MELKHEIQIGETWDREGFIWAKPLDDQDLTLIGDGSAANPLTVTARQVRIDSSVGELVLCYMEQCMSGPRQCERRIVPVEESDLMVMPDPRS